ncbi:hypothetical protein [Acetobacter sp. A11-2]|uniref:hypothetical protein n=1 Tax=Acetobacter sp. A11-2 TaxID=3157859 RepID=UPI0032F04DE5
MLRFIVILFIAFVGYKSFQIYTSIQDDNKRNAEKLVAHPCIKDWHACKDISELMNYNEEIDKARMDCDIKLDNFGHYGSPVWESSFHKHFDSWYKNNNFKKSGYAVLVDNKAFLPTEDGGKERVVLQCFYDLNKHRVDNVLRGD